MKRDINLAEIFDSLCAVPFLNRFNPENKYPFGFQPFSFWVKLSQGIQKLWCEPNTEDPISKLGDTYTCGRIICDQLIKDLSPNTVILTKVFVVWSWILPQCKTNVQRVNYIL